MKNIGIFVVFIVCGMFACKADHPQTVRVRLGGQFQKPGLYDVNPYATINELITMAGGLNKTENKYKNNRSFRIIVRQKFTKVGEYRIDDWNKRDLKFHPIGEGFAFEAPMMLVD